MKAPMTPPSNRMVSPGQRRRCARVAASSGMPTPANTVCPSLSWRALTMVSSSAAVCSCALLSIIDALPGAGGFEQLVHADEGEKLAPRFRAVHVIVEILLHSVDRILVHQSHI